MEGTEVHFTDDVFVQPEAEWVAAVVSLLKLIIRLQEMANVTQLQIRDVS